LKNDGPILILDKLYKRFGRVSALAGIDLTLDKPGVYGFLGPNGAGKTTTFKLVCALLRPTAGRVLINGIDVQKDTRKAMAKLGVQFDAPAFYPYLTSRENLQLIACWLDGNHQEEIDDLLSLVGLSDAKHRRVGGYSWGMKQRLGLAAALLSDPQLLLLDEPTNGLDPGGIADIRCLLPRLAHEQGRTVFVSSHRMEEVEQTCDQVAIIHRGVIVAWGTLAELASRDTRIEIRCEELQMALDVLQKIDGIGNIERTGLNCLQVLRPRVASSKINQILVEHGVAVEQIVERRESLEEMFFRLTGVKTNE
jgi:ABC-type multidrug transport system ATPase subunit